MLCLCRKPGQRIYIGNNVWLEVRSIKGNQVRIAIEAPKSVAIRRAEIKEKAA